MNECKIDEFDAETFPVIVPVNLALLEKKFEKTLTDLIVPGTKICFTNEVLWYKPSLRLTDFVSTI